MSEVRNGTIQNSGESSIQILQNEEFGRYLVATKDIEELSLILNETPMTYGPGDDDHDIDQGEVPMCLGCCVRLSNNYHRCSQCGWPVCGEKCQNMGIHAKNECILFREGGISYPPPHTWPIINKSVLTLRCLFLKEKDQEDWDSSIGKLEHHTDVRYQKSYCVKGDEMLMDNLEYFFGRSCQDDAELRNEIIKISGIINVNAFSTTNPHSNIANEVMIAQCIYRTGSLFANSCVPNCTWRIGPSPSFQICVRSAVPIKKGEMITISYSPHDILFSGTLQRQISSEDMAHFTCSCSRCKDPSEFGTFISAVKCSMCYNLAQEDEDRENCTEILMDNNNQGYLLPLNPLVPDSPWICNSKLCDESQTVHKTFAQTYPIQEMFETIKGQRLERADEILELERVLEMGRKIVHPNHYLMQDIRMHIVKKQIPVLQCLDEEQLKNLVHHTKMLLNVANILAPGFSQIRALLQHFLALELRVQNSQFERRSPENETESNDEEPDSNTKFIHCLETMALMFFQSHNYQPENEIIIRNIKNSLTIE